MFSERMWKVFIKLRSVSVITLLVLVGMVAGQAKGEKIDTLEQQVKQLTEDVQQLKARRIDESKLSDPDSWLNKFTLGGYGEMHANFGEGSTADFFDLHRLVIYLGYDFNEWIKFHTEIELEHAWTDAGYVLAEQAYIDFLTHPKLNFRVGRILTPLGIINMKHEPPTFNGVERPLFAKVIIPTTWSSDGAGIYGTLSPWLKYQLYVVGGLDGSMFDAKDGIRDGRIKGRPSLHEPAGTGRIDVYPLAGRSASHDQKLRIGLSCYYGGLDNGKKGANPDVNGDLFIYSSDFEYSISKFDFRGAIAHELITSAAELGAGTASQIFGFYVEGAYHFWPEAWKTGKLKDSDAVFFTRFDLADTQHKMPSGVSRDPAGDRSEVTIGFGFYPIPNLVIKADYQIRQDESSDDLSDLMNLGVGWEF